MKFPPLKKPQAQTGSVPPLAKKTTPLEATDEPIQTIILPGPVTPQAETATKQPDVKAEDTANNTPKNTETAASSNKAVTLAAALPFMRRYAGKTFVIKYGGHAMGDKKLADLFAQDVVLLKQVGINPVIVHGGGPQIGQMLERLKIKSQFVDGLRVTDADTVEVVEMVLSGIINKSIAAAINQAGGKAIGLSGKDGNLMMAQPIKTKPKKTDSSIEKVLDLGFVGEPTNINPDIINELTASGIIPVIAPIGTDEDGKTYNINADTAAGAIAAALNATRLLLLTDVVGVLDQQKKLVPKLTRREADDLIGDKVITGGMIPKIRTCMDAVDGGVEGAVIIDGRVPHALLLEIFTEEGAGTIIGKSSKPSILKSGR